MQNHESQESEAKQIFGTKATFEQVIEANADKGKVVGTSKDGKKCSYEITNDGFEISKNTLYVNWFNAEDQATYDFSGPYKRNLFNNIFYKHVSADPTGLGWLQPGTRSNAKTEQKVFFDRDLQITELRLNQDGKELYVCIFIETETE